MTRITKPELVAINARLAADNAALREQLLDNELKREIAKATTNAPAPAVRNVDDLIVQAEDIKTSVSVWNLDTREVEIVQRDGGYALFIRWNDACSVITRVATPSIDAARASRASALARGWIAPQRWAYINAPLDAALFIEC